MSFRDREALLNEDVIMEDLASVEGHNPTYDMLPPGQEGLFMSHAGGEEEVLDDLLGQFHPRK